MIGSETMEGDKDITENIKIVLSRPLGAGNIGSVARAMMNTGFSSLALVTPAEYKNDEGFSMACNASEVLLGASEFSSLAEAVIDSEFVIGATRRDGKIRAPLLTLDEAADYVLRRAQKNRVSVVFGSERHGLDNEEIGLCDLLFEIPTHEGYPSLNLSHAVFAFCHTIFTSNLSVEATERLAPRSDILEMFAHLERTLRGVEYGEKGGEYLLQTIMRNFRRLFARTALFGKEVNMLRGILTQIEERTISRSEEPPEDKER